MRTSIRQIIPFVLPPASDGMLRTRQPGQSTSHTFIPKSSDRLIQGGDGLVAARHLHHFRYKPTIYLPKPGSKEIYQRLLRQCENLKIPVIHDTDKFTEGLKSSDAILDAVFGESYSHVGF